MFKKGANWQKQQQDNFAIEFQKWVDKLIISGSSVYFKKTKELLEIFKKEKGYE